MGAELSETPKSGRLIDLEMPDFRVAIRVGDLETFDVAVPDAIAALSREFLRLTNEQDQREFLVKHLGRPVVKTDKVDVEW